MSYFLKQKEEYFKNLLLIEKTPSADCLSDLFSMLNPKEFMRVFVEWVSEIVEKKTGMIIAIDGKAVRSARDKINGENTPYVLSAYLSELGISVGQVEVDKKSNEQKTIPDLLKLLDIKGNYITIDAAGTNEKIAKQIVGLNGHYVLKVKGNEPTLMNDIASYFKKNISKFKPEIIKDKKNHGREERREYYISYNTNCITNKEKWGTVKSIAMIRVYRKIGDKTTVTEHYYIMDVKIKIEMFVRTTRNHWNIECGLHWRLDVIFNEDRSRSRRGHSVINLSSIRKIVFNLITLDTSFGKISFQKKLTHYKTDFANIENLIFRVLPNNSML
jgi:predicted transposase YbfD/YdcC